MKISIALLLTNFLLLAGCAMKTKVLDASIVSMTRANLPPGASLQETGEVQGSFCADHWNDKGQIGLFDVVIKNAQKKYGVDFITNASFFVEGSCVSVEGTGQRLKGVASSSGAR